MPLTEVLSLYSFPNVARFFLICQTFSAQTFLYPHNLILSCFCSRNLQHRALWAFLQSHPERSWVAWRTPKAPWRWSNLPARAGARRCPPNPSGRATKKARAEARTLSQGWKRRSRAVPVLAGHVPAAPRSWGRAKPAGWRAELTLARGGKGSPSPVRAVSKARRTKLQSDTVDRSRMEEQHRWRSQHPTTPSSPPPLKTA